MNIIKIITVITLFVSYIHSNEVNDSINISTTVQNDFYKVVNEALSRPRGWPPIAYAVKLNRGDVVKYLLDHGEDANASTPSLPLWYESSSSDRPSCIGNLFEGYVPLEIAVFYENVEMVKILTTYCENNRAIPEISHIRYIDLMWNVPKDIWDIYGGVRIETALQNSINTTPFLEALKTNNEELIIAVMQSYTNLDAFFLLRETVTQKQNPHLMRSWIEHQMLLRQDHPRDIPDQVVDLFLHYTLSGLISDNDYTNVELLLDYGWPIKEKEVLKLIQENNQEALHFLLSRKQSYLGFDIYDLLLKNNLQDLVSECLSLETVPALIRHNQYKMLKQAMDTLGFIPSEEDQLLAIKNGANEVIALFISRGWFWKGALLQAVENGKVNIVKTLLQSFLFKDEIENAKIIAYNKRLFEILELLEEKSA